MIILGIDPGLTQADEKSGLSLCKILVTDEEIKDNNTGLIYKGKYIYIKWWKMLNLHTNKVNEGIVNFVKLVSEKHDDLVMDDIDVIAMEKQFYMRNSVNVKMIKFSTGLIGTITGINKDHIPDVKEVSPKLKFNFWKTYCTHPTPSKKRRDKKKNGEDITRALLKDNDVLLKYFNSFKKQSQRWDMADSFLTAMSYIHKHIL